MTNHETAAIDRIPITRSVSYAVRGAPELPAHGATIPGTTLAPTQITFTYQAAPDSQLGRIQARVKGFWMRDGGRVNPGQPMAQHYFDGLTDWPEWLAEEARLHDPEAAVSVPPPAPQADDRAALRDRIAAAIWERQNPGRRYADCEYRWQADAEADADAVLAVLPEPADQAAAFREAANALAAVGLEDSLVSGPRAWAEAIETLRRMADEAQSAVSGPVAGEQQNETPEAVSRPTRYEVNLVPETDDPGGIYAITVEYRGDNRWAVLRHSLCLSLDGQWDRERNSSEREEEWLDAHRFDLGTALRLAEEQAVDIAPAKWSGRDRKPQHVGGRVNAEDCPACHGTNPPYPFICPGPSAVEEPS